MLSLSRSAPRIVLAALLLVHANHLHSWGFGKNKVQYENLSWRYHELPHLHTFYHQNQGKLPPITARWAHNAYRELQKDFSFTHKKPVPLLVYASPTLFEQTNVILEVIPEGVGGFTEIFKNRIVVPFTGSYEEFRHVVHHELVHAFTFGILYDQLGGSLFRNSGANVPLWFAEGSAEYLSSNWNVEADMFLMDRTIHGSVPLPGPELGGYMAYKGGQSFLHFLAASRGDSAFHSFLLSFRNTRSVETSAKAVYRQSISDLGKEWIRELKRIYWPEIGRRQNPADYAQAVTNHREDRSHFNLKPRISPNGERIAFFSDTKDYARILITDRNGDLKTSIKQNGYGGYFESFQPFRSGLCWAPDNKRLAFVTKSDGDNEIRIVDIADKELIRTIQPDLQSINSPDWSPGSERLLFCGLDKDRTDIFMYDFEQDSLSRLTNDFMHETDPRFSRDGKSVVFAAQDTSGDARRTAARPNFELYRLDLKTGETVRLTRTPWNETAPAFSPNGADLAYISDKNGIDNIYIAPVDSIDHASAITDFIGGCSSPDWSYEGNTMVFCLFQKQGWDIWRMDTPYKRMLDSALAQTNWRLYTIDSSAAFFSKREIPPRKDTIPREIKDPRYASRRSRQSDTSGIVEFVDSLGDSSSAASADNLSPKDSARGDTAAVAIQTADSAGPAQTNAVLTASDSAGQTPGDSSIQPTAAAQTESMENDSSGQTPELNSRPYRLRFSPDMATVGMGISTVYGYSGQGLIMLSDMLGNHRISLAGDMQGNLNEYFLYGAYLNSQYRLDFGASVSYSKSYTFESIYGDDLYHDTNLGLSALLRYPFSVFSRLDLSLYYRKQDRTPHTFRNGELVFDSSREQSQLIVMLPSLRYVFDNILWGITGPVNGIRAQLNVMTAPPVSYTDVGFISADIDVRRYFHFARRFVLATRVTAGAAAPLGAERSGRRFFLGGTENWIFGEYGVNIDNYEQNRDNILYSDIIVPFRGWDYFDIVGSRFALANVEFRFPFIREIGIAWPLPISIRYINGALFADIGNAWNKEDQHEFIALPRDIYGGVGYGLRANLGIFVLRYDRAWPTDWQRHVGSPTNYFSLGAEF